ncbi:putative transcriptional regulator [Providencia alcalifaciens]|nr:putative transcriptional regulator [Providencia alcalifaciens]
MNKLKRQILVVLKLNALTKNEINKLIRPGDCSSEFQLALKYLTGKGLIAKLGDKYMVDVI